MVEISRGSIKEVVAFRLKPGMDVMKSLAEICEEHKIDNAIILSAIGSLQGAHYLNPVPTADSVCGYAYGEALQLYGPIELVSAAGMICHSESGEIMLHVHCSLSDQNGNAYGGHMIDGNKVLITTDVVLGVVDKINMVRKYDEETGFLIFMPEQA